MSDSKQNADEYDVGQGLLWSVKKGQRSWPVRCCRGVCLCEAKPSQPTAAGSRLGTHIGSGIGWGTGWYKVPRLESTPKTRASTVRGFERSVCEQDASDERNAVTRLKLQKSVSRCCFANASTQGAMSEAND